MTLNNYIDHTLLKPTATSKDIINLCKEAIEHEFASVCVNSCYVKLANKEVKKSSVKVCSVIGFPLGAMSTRSKIFEAKRALKDGADEIDMVLNVGFLKSNQQKKVQKEIRAIKKIMPKNILKVILETCYLNDDEIKIASQLAINAKADYIKTSTGFGTRGASENDVKIMKGVARDQVKIKASGGIKDAETAQKYIALGADRLGTSSGIAIISGAASNSEY